MRKTLLLTICILTLSATGCGVIDEILTSSTPTSSEQSSVVSTLETSSYDLWEDDTTESTQSSDPVSEVSTIEATTSSAPIESSKNDTSSETTSSKQVVVSSAPPKTEEKPAPTSSTQETVTPPANTEQIVYWGQTGTKYHRSAKCRTFKGNTPNSGTIEEAIAEGRTAWCKVCS